MSKKEVDRYPWRKRVKTLPQPFKVPVTNMIKMGHIPELSDSRAKVRETLGINRSPPTAYKDKNALSELQELVKHTNLDEKIAWNWKKGKSDY